MIGWQTRLASTGASVEVIGKIVDLFWHHAHTGHMEHGSELWTAHGVLYAGMILLLVGCVTRVMTAGFIDGTTRGLWWTTVVAAAVQTTGAATDAPAHLNGSESALGHALMNVGLAVLLMCAIGFTLMAVQRQRGQKAMSSPR